MDILSYIVILQKIKAIFKNPLAAYIGDSEFMIDGNGLLQYNLTLDESVIEDIELEVNDLGVLKCLITLNGE